MGLTSAISSLQTAQAAGQISLAVARTAMDAQKAQGEAAIALIEAAAETMEQVVAQAAAGDLGAKLDLLA